MSSAHECVLQPRLAGHTTTRAITQTSVSRGCWHFKVQSDQRCMERQVATAQNVTAHNPFLPLFKGRTKRGVGGVKPTEVVADFAFFDGVGRFVGDQLCQPLDPHGDWCAHSKHFCQCDYLNFVGGKKVATMIKRCHRLKLANSAVDHTTFSRLFFSLFLFG